MPRRLDLHWPTADGARPVVVSFAMPLLSAFDVDPLGDGRQSPGALKVRRGASRLLREMGFGIVPEVTLPSGRRADLLALGPEGEVWIVEIKSSLADFRADDKWPDYGKYCDRFWFASAPELADHLPPETGVIVTDGFDAEVLREAPVVKLKSNVRRAVTMLMALTASRRLHALEDPPQTVSAFH